jgi:hypothetical protein
MYSGAANTARIEIGTGANTAGMNSPNAATDIAFWAGASHANRATAPFFVKADGALVATKATVQSAASGTRVIFDAATSTIIFRDDANEYSKLYSSSGATFFETVNGLFDIRAVTGSNLRLNNNGANIILFDGSSAFGGGVGVMKISNRGTAPTSDPIGGGFMYSEGGAGKWRGSSGTTTTFGPAEPHCKRCGRDFATEWSNPEYGKLSICMWCLVEGLKKIGIDPTIEMSQSQ